MEDVGKVGKAPDTWKTLSWAKFENQAMSGQNSFHSSTLEDKTMEVCLCGKC